MLNSQFSFLKEAELLLLEGKIIDAFDVLNNLEKNKDLTKEEKIACELLRSSLIFEQGDFKKSLELVENILKSNQKLDNKILIIKGLFLTIKNLIKQKNFKQCDSLIEKVELLLEDIDEIKNKKLISKRQKATLLNLKGEIQKNSGNLDEAIKYVTESIKLFEEVEFNYGKAEAMINIAKIYSTKGELDQALEFFKKSSELWKEMGNKLNFAKNLMNIGNTYTDKGELDKALEFFQESYDICKQINEKRTLANNLGSIGINHAMKGELDEALKYFLESLKLCEELKDQQIQAKNLGSIGILHHSKGELSQALYYYQQSLGINRDIGNIDGVVIFLGNIGEIHRLRGELDEALNHYQESLHVYEEIGGKSIPMGLALANSGLVYQQKGKAKKALEFFEKGFEIFKDSGNTNRMAEMYFFELTLLIDINQLEKAENILKELQNINEQEENKMIKQMTEVSEALLLKTNKRAKNRAKAEELLSQIITEDVINYEVYQVALINLSELFLIELQLTGDEEALEDLKSIMDKQLNIAKQQNSYSLLVETYFLQAQLAMIELDNRKAQLLLNQAQLLAEEKGLKRLAMKLSSEYDYYFVEREIWNEFTGRETPIDERLSQTSLEETILRMIKKRAVEFPKFIEEESVLFLIVAEVGIPLFSQYFGPEAQLDQYLIGGFLTAINMFTKEAFATGGSIERIKHQDYTIVLQFKESLGFCYIFKGPSYGAMSKLSRFIQILEKPANSKILKTLVDKKNSIKIDSEQKKLLELLTRKIFLKEE